MVYNICDIAWVYHNRKYKRMCRIITAYHYPGSLLWGQGKLEEPV